MCTEKKHALVFVKIGLTYSVVANFRINQTLYIVFMVPLNQWSQIKQLVFKTTRQCERNNKSVGCALRSNMDGENYTPVLVESKQHFKILGRVQNLSDKIAPPGALTSTPSLHACKRKMQAFAPTTATLLCKAFEKITYCFRREETTLLVRRSVQLTTSLLTNVSRPKIYQKYHSNTSSIK